MFYKIRLIAHDSTVLAGDECDTLKAAKKCARDYIRDPEYFSAEPHKAEVLNDTDTCVFDVFAPQKPPADPATKRQLDRLALFAAQHSHAVKICYPQHCITVGVEWINSAQGTRGTEWHVARDLKSLRDVLGY